MSMPPSAAGCGSLRPAVPRTTRAARRRAALGALMLGAATVLVFLPLRQAEFLLYDDGLHVTANPHTRIGITWAGIVWALTHTTKWIPLTWMSHMLDSHLFGLDAGAHHLSGAVLHALNSGLLLYILFRYTAAFWPSAWVAALFALHPLHVEAVAWISSRPHLVSTCFWLAALLGWARFLERRTAARYGAVCGCLILGIMSKGIVVTLPAVLLLLDRWPLDRWPPASGDTSGPSRWELLREKLPLALIATASIAAQILEQRTAGTLMPLDVVPLSLRLAHVPLNYAAYVGRLLWPVDLAIVYPLSSQPPPAWAVAASALGLGAVTALALGSGRARGYWLTGWGWYLITLLPVIGFFPIGRQVFADRYTYVPLIGLFIAAAWTAADLAARRAAVRPALAIAGGAAVLACAALTRTQLAYWRDGVALFGHAVAVTTDNAVAENNLGSALRAAGRHEDARRHFAAAVRINPDYPEAHNNLGTALVEAGEANAAETHFQTAIALRPSYAAGRVSLGILRLRRGNFAGAQEQFAAAIELEPDNATAHIGLAQALEAQGRGLDARAAYEQAIARYREDLRLNPNQADAHNALGLALRATGQRDDARAHFTTALRIAPGYPEAAFNLGLLLAEEGELGRAEEQFRRVLDRRPTDGAAHLRLAQVLEAEQRPAEATDHYRTALQFLPGAPEALAGLQRLGVDNR